MRTKSKNSASATTSPAATPTTGDKAGGSKPAKAKPSLKPKQPSEPGLNVTAFVALMRKLEPMPLALTDEQVRFVQLCIQRYQHDQQGTVKTKLVALKPMKSKADRPRPLSPNRGTLATDLHSDALLERLTHAASEDDVIREIEAMSDAAAEKWAASQDLRSGSPAEARQKLLETVITLRQMSRIQHAGKSSSSAEQK
jgi:hypothetical protein